MFHKILLCSDGSEDALKAARAAAEIARKFDASLIVLHVFQRPVLPAYLEGSLSQELIAFEETVAKVKESVVSRTGAVLEEAGVPFTIRHEDGHPADVIVSIAEQEQVDLIVLGRRGVSAVSAFLLGSVSDRVCHHARCSVLLLR